jgi:hypothetical protein
MGALSRGRIAIVGGRGSTEGIGPFGDRVVAYGSVDDAGAGSIRRLEAALRGGRYATVVVLARWSGHSAFTRIRRACRNTGTRLVVWPNGISSLARELAAA